MKKLLLILLLLFTLKSSSQTICDSVVVNGSAWQMSASIGTPGAAIFMIDSWVTTDPLGNILGQSSISSYHNVFVNTLQDTIVMCLTVSFGGPWFFPGTCCLTLVWDGVRWVKHYVSVWPSGLYEVQPMHNNGKMYDLFGRELFVIPQNKVYIKNSRLYIEK